MLGVRIPISLEMGLPARFSKFSKITPKRIGELLLLGLGLLCLAVSELFQIYFNQTLGYFFLSLAFILMFPFFRFLAKRWVKKLIYQGMAYVGVWLIGMSISGVLVKWTTPVPSDQTMVEAQGHCPVFVAGFMIQHFYSWLSPSQRYAVHLTEDLCRVIQLQEVLSQKPEILCSAMDPLSCYSYWVRKIGKESPLTPSGQVFLFSVGVRLVDQSEHHADRREFEATVDLMDVSLVNIEVARSWKKPEDRNLVGDPSDDSERLEFQQIKELEGMVTRRFTREVLQSVSQSFEYLENEGADLKPRRRVASGASKAVSRLNHEKKRFDDMVTYWLGTEPEEPRSSESKR